MTGPSQNLRNQVATRAAADAAPTGGPTQAPPTIFQMIERQKAEIGRALPQHMNPDRLARVIMTVIRQTPQLLECTHASLLGAAMLSAQTGLEPGPLGHCYWLPFRNSRAGTMEVTWIMGYKGMIDLARRSGQLVSIEARAVRQNDLFEFEYGLDERLRHVPAEGERGDLTKVYMIARFKDGGRYFRVMTRAEVEEHRNRSKAKDRGPWVTDYEAMACKTVIRAAAAFLPLSVEVAQAAIADDTVHRGVVNVQDMGYALPEMPPPAPALPAGDGPVYDAGTGEVSTPADAGTAWRGEAPPETDPEAERDRALEASREREAAAAAEHTGGDEAPAPDVEDPPAVEGWPETQAPGTKRSR